METKNDHKVKWTNEKKARSVESKSAAKKAAGKVLRRKQQEVETKNDHKVKWTSEKKTRRSKLKCCEVSSKKSAAKEATR